MTNILVINPNMSTAMSDNIRLVCEQAADPDSRITVANPRSGPESIESYTEDAFASAAALRLIARADESDYDALIMACFDDPAVDAARELVSVPVLGIAESAMHLATLLAPSFAVVTVTERAVHRLGATIHRSGLASKCTGIKSTSLSVLDTNSREQTIEKIRAAATEAIERDQAESIVLGCAGLGPLEAELSGALGVPVLDGCGCAVKLAEALHHYGLSTSKIRTYSAPPSKRWFNEPGMSRDRGNDD